MARSRPRGGSGSEPTPSNTVRFGEPWSTFARGGIVPRREIPINPNQAEEYRYRLNLCVIAADGSPTFRRVEYDSPVQIRPETLQRIVALTIDETGNRTYRHGRRVTGPLSGQPCGATVEGITRRS